MPWSHFCTVGLLQAGPTPVQQVYSRLFTCRSPPTGARFHVWWAVEDRSVLLTVVTTGPPAAGVATRCPSTDTPSEYTRIIFKKFKYVYGIITFLEIICRWQQNLVCFEWSFYTFLSITVSIWGCCPTLFLDSWLTDSVGSRILEG